MASLIITTTISSAFLLCFGASLQIQDSPLLARHHALHLPYPQQARFDERRYTNKPNHKIHFDFRLHTDNMSSASTAQRLGLIQQRLWEEKSEEVATVVENDPYKLYQLAVQLEKENGEDGVDLIESLEQQVNQVLSQQNDPSAGAAVSRAASATPSALQAHVTLLEQYAVVRQELDTSVLNLEQPAQAARHWIAAQQAFQKTATSSSYSDIQESLHDALEQQRERLVECARKNEDTILTVSRTSIRAVADSDVWLWQVLLPGELATLLQDVWMPSLYAHVWQPLTHSSVDMTDIFSMDRYQVSDRKSELFLEWKTTSIAEGERKTAIKTWWNATLDFVQSILGFWLDSVLAGNATCRELVGTALWGSGNKQSLLSLLLETLEATCVIPVEASSTVVAELEALGKDLQTILNDFVVSMQEKFPEHCIALEEISAFPGAMIQKYGEQRQLYYLASVRVILQKDEDFHDTTRVGIEVTSEADKASSVIALPEMSVSKTAVKVLQHCRSVMDEASMVASDSNNERTLELAGHLHTTARSVLDLYRAVIPIAKGREIASIPHVAAVVHNDGLFLAHACLVLGLEYREKFPEWKLDSDAGCGDAPSNPRRHQTYIFLDKAPLFYHMAEKSLFRMVEIQSQQIKTLVSERIPLLSQALQSNEPLAEWSDAEMAVDAGLYHLEHIQKAWLPVLEYTVLERCMTRLRQGMLGLFLDPILGANDISVAATHFVRTLLERAQQHQKDARCTAVAICMDMTLRDIKAGLSDGTFASLRASELIRLIQACFDDSPTRRSLIDLLRKHVD